MKTETKAEEVMQRLKVRVAASQVSSANKRAAA